MQPFLCRDFNYQNFSDNRIYLDMKGEGIDVTSKLDYTVYYKDACCYLQSKQNTTEHKSQQVRIVKKSITNHAMLFFTQLALQDK